jgi:hypothetical protein
VFRAVASSSCKAVPTRATSDEKDGKSTKILKKYEKMDVRVKNKQKACIKSEPLNFAIEYKTFACC